MNELQLSSVSRLIAGWPLHHLPVQRHPEVQAHADAGDLHLVCGIRPHQGQGRSG